MINNEIARIFSEMAVFMEMNDVPFKPAAYEKAADEIREYPDDLKIIYRAGGRRALDAIPKIGASLAEKIEEYVKTGRVHEYEQMKKKFPINLRDLSGIEGLGPKTIKALYQKLGIKTLRQLELAASTHKISSIPHFGEKTERNILEHIAFLKQSGGRQILGYVLPFAKKIEERLRGIKGVTNAIVAGSIRRREETVGDIDILVTTTHPRLATNAFVSMPEVMKIHAHGAGRASVHLANGMNADLKIVTPKSFGAALLYFTGDKQHNVLLRKHAIEQKMKLNEYGLFEGNRRIASRTEEDIYSALGFGCPAPEIRTANGELEAAARHTLPQLLPYGSVRGDLQTQTNWTDGSASIKEMAEAAIKLGREYIAITDHTRTLAMTGGLDEKKLTAQGKEIDKLNSELKRNRKKFRVLKGAEVNILKDGSLDISDSALAKLDVVGAAVHTHFKLPRREMTQRIIRAMQNPHLDILFHPTGRLINRRPAYDVDMRAIITAAKKYRVALEIDAYPDRSDLHDKHVRMAVASGAKLVIDTDAHAPDHLRFIELGESIARRGWAEKKDILNTLPLQKLLVYFQKKYEINACNRT